MRLSQTINKFFGTAFIKRKLSTILAGTQGIEQFWQEAKE